MLVDHGDLIVAKSVQVVLVEQHATVVDQKLPDLLLPEREHQAARVTVAKEIQAVVVVTPRLSIEKVQALFIEAAARVVEHDVRDDGDAVEVTEVDERL